MSSVVHLPYGAETYPDARGDARAMRVRWHHEDDLVVLSLWRGRECTATFRLDVHEVPALITTLQAGLDASYDVQQRA